MPATAEPREQDAPLAAESALASAHARLARVVLAVNFAAALVAIALLVAALYNGYTNHLQSLRDDVSDSTRIRAAYLGRHLALLAVELRRLGLRSEVNLLDQNNAPERSLLELSHSKSTFFDVGVAILDAGGQVVWSEPEKFLEPGASLANAPWFDLARTSRSVQILPVRPATKTTILYVVSPIIRSGAFEGALLGAIDLARGSAVELETGTVANVTTMVVARDGTIVYPAQPPDIAGESGWGQVLGQLVSQPFTIELPMAGRETLVSAAAVTGSDLSLVSTIGADVLFAPAQGRFLTRLMLGLALAFVPNVALFLILRRSLRVFRRSEEDAVRDQRLRHLGEAANLIAHEVKNALNGLRMGVDVVLAGERGERGDSGPRPQAVSALRRELERLSDFTTELLIFSRGVVPRPIAIDLANLVPRVTELAEKNAADLGVALEVDAPARGVCVRADPSLIHVVVTNLVGNAIEAVAGHDVQDPRVKVAIAASGVLATVRVTDNGPGVPAATKDRLFEPFVTGKPSGVGIGLALSRKIARAHGGDLVLERSRTGASFLLSLPMTDMETRAE